MGGSAELRFGFFTPLVTLQVAKPYSLPNMHDIMLNLEGFTYASAIDLNMGYYHIKLSPDAQKMCTIVMTWGKYEYLR